MINLNVSSHSIKVMTYNISSATMKSLSVCLTLVYWISSVQGHDIYFRHGGVNMVYHKRSADQTALDDCECQCETKFEDERWECCECAWDKTACFPGEVSVTLSTNKQIQMSELRPGHQVLTVTNEGKQVYSEVRTFLKRLPDSVAVYLDIVTDDDQMISLSQSHVMFSSPSNTSTYTSLFAGRLKIGDYIYTTKNCHQQLCPVQIKHIQQTVREGAYVPLTEEGTIIVNDMLASCYSSVDHNIAHIALTPIRWFPWLLGDYQGEGYSPFVHALKMIGHWILPDSMQYDMTVSGSTLMQKSEI